MTDRLVNECVCVTFLRNKCVEDKRAVGYNTELFLVRSGLQGYTNEIALEIAAAVFFLPSNISKHLRTTDCYTVINVKN